MATTLPYAVTLADYTDAAHLDWHQQIYDNMPRLGLLKPTAGSIDHWQAHLAIANDIGLQRASFRRENHLLAHSQIHAYLNVLTTTSYGPKSNYTQPGGSTSVAPGSLTAALISGAAANTKFWIQAGRHQLPRGGQLVPTNSGIELHGEPGSIITGADILTGWTSDGAGHWYVGGRTQLGTTTSGELEDATNYPRVNFNDDVFRNGKPLRHVATLANCVSGTFFFDYTGASGPAGRVYVGDDPTNALMEIANCMLAIDAGSVGMVLRNLTIEKFGSPAQIAAVKNKGTTQDCLVQHCHGIAINHGSAGQVTGCKIHENGQMGVSGGDAVAGVRVFQNNEVCHNNYANFGQGWEAGGSKWVTAGANGSETVWQFTGGSSVPQHVTGTTGLHVCRNWFHDNKSHGFWADIDNYHVLCEDNVSQRHTLGGYVHEIGFDAIIRRNVSHDDGRYNDTGVTREFFPDPDGQAWDAWRWTPNGQGAITVVGADDEGRLWSPASASGHSLVRSTRAAMTAVDVTCRVRSTTTPGVFWLVLRGDAGTSALANGYYLKVAWAAAGVTIELRKKVASVDTLIQTIVGTGIYTASSTIRVRAQASGTTLRVKHWPDTTPEPLAWDYTGTDSSVSSGVVRLESESDASSNRSDIRVADLTIDDLNRTTSKFYADISGIAVTESEDTYVVDNAIRDAAGACLMIYESNRAYVVANVVMEGNAVTQRLAQSAQYGLCLAYERVAGTDTSSWRVTRNHYMMPDLTTNRWKIDASTYNWAGWQALGHDAAGTAQV